jgi:probable molybdopterin binding protein
MRKTIKIEDALGRVLAHDITEIRKGEFKGRAFKKGHKIERKDICHLQRLGKRHIYVIEHKDGFLHEDEAALSLADAFCGQGVAWKGEPKEGKLKLFASSDGLLSVNVDALTEINMLEKVMCATVHNNTMVKQDAIVGATRAIPLFIEQTLVEKAANIAKSSNGILSIRSVRRAKTAILITGSEIVNNIIEDQFEPILRYKIASLGSEVVDVDFATDDSDIIKKKIMGFIDNGADLILSTGGMSVDPDDVTREGILKAGADNIIYGSPVLPGAMFMIAYIGDTQVLGVPACGIYHETTMLDLILPRVLAGERLTRKELAVMGHGGLCMNCPECRYPICPFGK